MQSQFVPTTPPVLESVVDFWMLSHTPCPLFVCSANVAAPPTVPIYRTTVTTEKKHTDASPVDQKDNDVGLKSMPLSHFDCFYCCCYCHCRNCCGAPLRLEHQHVREHYEISPIRHTFASIWHHVRTTENQWNSIDPDVPGTLGGGHPYRFDNSSFDSWSTWQGKRHDEDWDCSDRALWHSLGVVRSVATTFVGVHLYSK